MVSYDVPRSYVRRYDRFGGVDLGSESSIISPLRFARVENCYKDYSHGGYAIESFAGFRRVLDLRQWLTDYDQLHDYSETDLTVYGMYTYEYVATNLSRERRMLVHAGIYLFLIKGYDETLSGGETVSLLSSAMNAHRSEYFLFDNVCYVLDGAHYQKLVGDVFSAVAPYVPVTVTGIIPDTENRSAGERVAQRNLLTSHFCNAFVVTGTATEFVLSTPGISSVYEVRLYGETVSDSLYTVDTESGSVTFATAPTARAGYDESYPALEIEAVISSFSDPISRCTVSTVYDDAVFFSGDPHYPGRIYFSMLNDPEYVGELNYLTDGNTNTPVRAMLSMGAQLMVLKDATDGEGAVYYHRRLTTDIDIKPRDYPCESGCESIGCASTAINFLDDAVFVSRDGLRGVGRLNLNSERSIERRSSMIDSALIGKDLTDAGLCEWNGYLLLYLNGNMYLGDSRGVFTNARGEREYEWYVVKDVGIYVGQYPAYVYCETVPPYLAAAGVSPAQEGSDRALANGNGETVNERTIVYDGETLTYHTVTVQYSDFDGATENVDYLVESAGYNVGGTFSAATGIMSDENNIWFGTREGVLCCFNFDMREGDELPASAYSADGRIFPSLIATISDDCSHSDRVKNTVPKSLMVKLRPKAGSEAKVGVITDNGGFQYVGKCSGMVFDFSDIRFDDMSFADGERAVNLLCDRSKNWLQKQIVVYSDEYMRPFALHRLSYEYTLGRKIKNGGNI